MNRSLVSVIIPCYNSAAFLSESIDSALGQSYADKEVIVVDDGSTDDSPRVMSGYGNAIRVVRQANAGLSAARNAGIRAAQGRYIAFLDADDYWAPSFLEKMVAAAEETQAGIAYCGWQNVGLPGPRGQPFVPPDYETELDKSAVFFSNPRWPVHAALLRRDVLDLTGGFDPKWKACEDFALWIRVAPVFRLALVPEVLAFYRFHDGQMSKNRAGIAMNHLAVQIDYLHTTPAAARQLPRTMRRQLMYGRLLRSAFEAYWARDLQAARTLFRRVMRAGYGTPRDWMYMLPSLLPLPFHAALIRVLGSRDA